MNTSREKKNIDSSKPIEYNGELMTATTETTDTMMQISKQTIEILKNFASINSNILIKPGNQIKTISNYKNVLSQATVQETFPVEFGVWDLNKMLGVISLFDDPMLDFQEKHVTIWGGKSHVEYYYSEPKLLTTVTKELKMPPAVVFASLDEEDVKEIQKAASVLQLPDIRISSNNVGGDIILTVMDRKDPSSNEYSFTIGNIADETEFNFYFKVENLKMLVGDYNLQICENSVAKFENRNFDLTYWIAMEPDSTYKAG